VVIEELPLVHGVVLFGHRAVHLQKAQRGEAQPALLETREELEGDASLERIGFEDDEGALGTHDAITTETSSATGGEIAASDARGPIAARYASSGRRYSRATRWMSAGVTPSMIALTSSTDRTRPRKSSCPASHPDTPRVSSSRSSRRPFAKSRTRSISTSGTMSSRSRATSRMIAFTTSAPFCGAKPA